MKKHKRNPMKKYLAAFLAAVMLVTSSSAFTDKEVVSAKEASTEILTGGEGEISAQTEETTVVDMDDKTDESPSGEDDTDIPGTDEVPNAGETEKPSETPVEGETDNSGETEEPADKPLIENEDTVTIPETVPEEDSTEEKPVEEEDFSGLMSIEELTALDDEHVDATMEKASTSLFGLLRAAAGSTWTFDAYYVNQDDRHDVKKTHDFNLKYQMEFHASQAFERGTIEIRIPAVLLTDRNGKDIIPNDIAVPKGTLENYTASRSTPFNYYMDKETKELVFFNYKEITAGTNAAWQVLYKNLSIIKIRDLTEWSLTPSITVKIPQGEGLDPITEPGSTEPLTGLVDSEAVLTKVTKEPYFSAGKQYTPGLYTESQVKSYISGELPEEYSGENFSNYKYVVWLVKIKGDCTQPWNLLLKDATTATSTDGDGNLVNVQGEIVGVKNRWGDTSDSYFMSIDIPLHAEYSEYTVVKENRTPKRDESGRYPWANEFWVVTAYEADKVEPGTVLKNDLSVKLEPVDREDKPDVKDTSASWSYVDYKWEYRGNIIGIEKYSPSFPDNSWTYLGWLEVYRKARERGEDWGDIPFNTFSECYGYAYTHHTAPGDPDLGERIPGTSYEVTTSDDFVYLYGGDAPSADSMLNGNDYYFSSVKITQTDRGYDVWEDDYAKPEEGGNLKIYAMFADTNPAATTETGWEYVDTVPWDESGRMTYTFKQEDLARKPWRVKAVHEAFDYATFCDINVKVRLRHDSEKLESLITATTQSVKLENISGVQGIYHAADGTETPFHAYRDQDQKPGNYKEDGLKEATMALYGMLTQRENAFAVLTGIAMKAESHKTSTSTNDPVHSRVVVDYTLTAYDGYLIYNEQGANYLKSSGVPSPGRNEVVFYDLLPYGMHFDPSSEIKAGRLRELSTGTCDYRRQSELWDQTQVTVTVGDDDVKENYNGTGRTMVIFHIKYSGTDSAVIWDGHWMEGWGVSFRAYYDWKDLDVAQDGMNISAFMPEDSEDAPLYHEPLYGGPGDVSYDNGVIPDVVNKEDYKYFGKDINKDGIEDIANVLYARTAAIEDVARANESKITKLVRADSDRFGIFNTSASVGPGEGYTYDINVSNANNEPLEDIVVYDRLENAATDRAEIEYETWPFEGPVWTGEFQSVITEGLEELGIVPVIYYNASRDAKISTGSEVPADVLTQENGWYTAEEWKNDGKKLSEVLAVAVDISQTATGKFQLERMKSVSFQIRMKAPERMPENGAVYAYNNPSFYSLHATDTGTDATVIGNSVRVSLGAKGQLEIIKKFSGEIPEQKQNTSFRFSLWENVNGEKQLFANQEYQLWKKSESGEWVRQTGRLYATDENGDLYLHADEKAVFQNLADVGRIQVKEEDDPYWNPKVEDKTEKDENTGLENRTVTVTNVYRSVLYVQKKLVAVPENLNTDAYEFTFQLLEKNVDGEFVPAANREYWYVDSVRLDGGIPAKVMELGNNGTGVTGADGTFKIKEGEIIAIQLDTGISWQLKETDGTVSGDENADWVCYTPMVKGGNLPVTGASASITNVYRWKDLNLIKKLTHQKPEDCTQEFTFKVEVLTDAEKDIREPLAGNRWVLLNENGEETETAGTLNADGTFKAACGGRTVKIERLEPGKTYIITETLYGEDYLPANDSVEVRMPVYSTDKDVVFTNECLLRPLSVTKTVAYDPSAGSATETVANKEFTFTISKLSEDGHTATILADQPYIIVENGTEQPEVYRTDVAGKFKLKHGQTATFKYLGRVGEQFRIEETEDEGYPQLYPLDKAANEVTIEDEGSECFFINGTPGNLLIQKEFVGANPDLEDFIKDILMPHGGSYEENIKPDYDFSVWMELEVMTAAGDTYSWPENGSVTISVLDRSTGDLSTRPWTEDGIYIYPWETIVVTKDQLETDVDVVSYALKEKKEYQNKPIIGLDLLVTQKEPKENGAFVGTLTTDPIAKIVNELSDLSEGATEIKKWMTEDSAPVNEGAKLVWRIERYDGNVWVPEEGVAYMTFNAGDVTNPGYSDEFFPTTKEYTCDRVLTTGADGKITLYKGPFGYPGIDIRDSRTVYLNGYAGMNEGDLRVVEVLEESDEAWGELAGYATKGAPTVSPIQYSMSLGSDRAKTFCNTNQKAVIELEKRMDDWTNESFTMVLKKVLSTSADPVTSPNQIVSSEPGAGISYTLYDSETRKAVGAGETTSSGELTLQAGQYARFEVGKGTLWTVSEAQKSGYILEDLSGTMGTTKLGDNLMILQPLGERTIVISSEMMVNKELLYDAGTGQLIDWTQETVKIPAYVKKDGVKYKVVGIGNAAFYRGRGGVKFKNLELPSTVTTIGYQAFTEYHRLEKIAIPNSVTSIGSYAFYDCGGLTSISIPESVNFIGVKAFMYCDSLTQVVFPKTLTTISDEMFRECDRLQSITIPDGVKRIGKACFKGCYRLEAVTIPGSVEVIDINAFDGCDALSSVTIGEGVKEIGVEAFFGCWNLETIKMPSTVKLIGGNAFGHVDEFPPEQYIYIDSPEDSIAGAPWGNKNAIITWDYTGI